MPPFFQEYLKQCDLKHKRVIPFATTIKTGKDASLNTLKEILPEADIDAANYYFASKNDKPDVNQWLDDLMK